MTIKIYILLNFRSASINPCFYSKNFFNARNRAKVKDGLYFVCTFRIILISQNSALALISNVQI